MKADYDLAIVGSGFAGSLMAMIGRRLGLSVVLLERGTHPRFAIGESSSPLANLLLEEISQEFSLPHLMPLTTFGAWQRAYPDVACGLKRGFTYYHHEAGKRFTDNPERQNQLLVAASPSDYVSDTHWFRADFDHFLLNEAISCGAEYFDQTKLSGICLFGACGPELEGERHGSHIKINARFVIDATGPRGFISNALSIPEIPLPGFPITHGLFSHFIDVPRCEDMGTYPKFGTPPYPPDDAALHHVFDGGWMWVLRFNNGVTSAGFAVEDSLARELRLNDGADWSRVLARFPSIDEQFDGAQPVQPFFYSPHLSYRAQTICGEGWAMLPSAAAFVDPLFSTGFPLTLLGLLRLASILEENGVGNMSETSLADYSRITFEEADWVAYFVSACYRSFSNMRAFSALSMYYFAAASYAEIARRIGRPDLAGGFMRASDPMFCDAMRQTVSKIDSLSRLSNDKEILLLEDRVKADLDRINIAGLCDPAKRNWYPVDLADVVRGASKLGVESDEMQKIVETAPWAATTAP